MAIAQPVYPDSDFSDDEQTPLDMSFVKAAEHLKKITNQLNNNQLLELYSHYKQGTEGKCNIPKPGWLDGKGRKKWEAWTSLEDMSQEEAKRKYIELVQKYDPQWSDMSEKETVNKETWVAVSSLWHSLEPDLSDNEMTILDAAKENCAVRISQLLEQNPELKEERDEDGLTALHWAADRDATEALTAAIRGGCDINALDSSGQTALHYAASCGHDRSTRILVAAGASMVKDEDGCTPMDLATDDNIKRILEPAMS